MDDKFKLEITYKSGRTITLLFSSFTIKRNGLNALSSIEWELHPNSKYKPLYLNVDQIESIYQVK